MHRVLIHPPALEDIRRHYLYLAEHSHTTGYPERWYDEIRSGILQLGESPLSHPLAPEDDHFKEEIRHRLVGSYRLLFTVREEEVHVLHVRHVRQDVLGAEEP